MVSGTNSTNKEESNMSKTELPASDAQNNSSSNSTSTTSSNVPSFKERINLIRLKLLQYMKSTTFDKISCFLAELIGTALLVLFGCMGCIETPGISNNHLQIVINFGLTIMFIIQIFGCVSGAHLNPAVTAAAFVYKMVTWQLGLIYFVGQMLGGFIGYGILKVLVSEEAMHAKNDPSAGLCLTIPNQNINVFQALGIEFCITAVLIFVCCGVWDPRNRKNHDSVPIKFGLTITALACAAGPWSGGSMNPARSFGPALWNANFTDHWIYWVAPLSAGFLVSLLYKIVFWRDVPEEKVRMVEEFPLSRDRNNA